MVQLGHQACGICGSRHSSVVGEMGHGGFGNRARLSWRGGERQNEAESELACSLEKVVEGP